VAKKLITNGAYNIEATGDVTLSSTGGTVSFAAPGAVTFVDVLITGNLDVQGSSTAVDSTNTTIKDNIIVINQGESGTGITLNYAGIEVDRGLADNVQLRYNEITDAWQITNDGSTFLNIFAGAGTALENILEDTTPQLGGNLDVNGNSIVSTSNGNIVFAPNGTGDVLPGTDSTYDFGATATRWANIYSDAIDATSITGTLQTAAQTNITSVGTLNGLGVTGTVTVTGQLDVDNLSLNTNTVTATTGAITLTPAAGSAVNLDDTNITADGGVFTIVGQLDVDNININGNTISSTDANGAIILTPNGTGATQGVVNINTNSAINLAAGTTAERPAAFGTAGDFRYNTSTANVEYSDGGSWTALIGISTNTISQGNTDISIADAGAGTITATVDGLTQLTINTTTADFQDNTITTTGTLNAGAITTNNSIQFSAASSYFGAGTTGVYRDAGGGLILQGQGSTNDIAILNDASVTVISIATGTSDVTFTGSIDATYYRTDSNVAGNQTSAGVMDYNLNTTRFLSWGAAATDGTFSWLCGQGGSAASLEMTLSPTELNLQNNAITTTGTLSAGDVNLSSTNPTLTLNATTNDSGIMTIGFDNNNTVAAKSQIVAESVGSWGRSNLHFVVDYAADANAPVLGTDTVLLLSGTDGSATFAGDIRVTTGDILPAADSTIQNVGTVADPWTNMHAAQFFGTATSAQYADLAENYLADADYEEGTVLDFGGAHEITQSKLDHSRRIAGVVSLYPASLMNSALEGNHVTAVALQGRVPVKVQGSIRKGDMMVSAGNGRARAEAEPMMGSVIGKALEDFDGGVEGIIEVVVGVR